MLAKFRQAKIPEIEALKKGIMPRPFQGKRQDFKKFLKAAKGIAIISEYKRSSPSLGVIRKDLEVENVAMQYCQAGTSAISILTESTYFDGKLEYLERAYKSIQGKIPLLRKDFIFDPLQIRATAATPASAILLIARMASSAKELRMLRELALEFDLAAVVEVFDRDDLQKARAAGADIIQVNARDLATLKVDHAGMYDIIEKSPPQTHELWIAASGINNPDQIQSAKDAGFQAVLIGSSLMKSKKPGDALAKLIGGCSFAL